MNDPAPPTTASAMPTKKRSRVLEYVLVLAVVGLVIAAAFFQEPITAFFGLHLWDKNAPGRTVITFLHAGKNGDQAAADAQLGTKSYKPLTENGRWAGYFIVTQAGRMDIPWSELEPSGEPQVTATEFVTLGHGAALVTVPGAGGKPEKYRLEMIENAWKITEIRGGHPAASPARPAARSGGSRAGGNRPAFRPPGGH